MLNMIKDKKGFMEKFIIFATKQTKTVTAKGFIFKDSVKHELYGSVKKRDVL